MLLAGETANTAHVRAFDGDGADDVGAFEILEGAGGVAEKVLQQVLVVLAECGCGFVVVGQALGVFKRGVSTGVGEGAPDGAAHWVHAGVGLVDELEVIAGLQVGVVVGVWTAVEDGGSWDALCLQPGGDVVAIALCRPLADYCV